MQKEKNQIVK